MSIKLFVGYEPREAVGLHVFLESLWDKASDLVSVEVLTPNVAKKLGITSDGTNSFTTTRFAIPELCGFEGWAIFADGADMLMRSDLSELWHLCHGREAVKVVKHDYETKHPRKYIGTALEADNTSYPRKNWSSLIAWNCGHPAHFRARQKLLSGDGKYLHRFSWLDDNEIGDLPRNWNHLIGEYEKNPNAKLSHFTLGIPGFEHYRRSEYSEEWHLMLQKAARGFRFFGSSLVGR